MKTIYRYAAGPGEEIRETCGKLICMNTTKW